MEDTVWFLREGERVGVNKREGGVREGGKERGKGVVVTYFRDGWVREGARGVVWGEGGPVGYRSGVHAGVASGNARCRRRVVWAACGWRNHMPDEAVKE